MAETNHSTIEFSKCPLTILKRMKARKSGKAAKAYKTIHLSFNHPHRSKQGMLAEHILIAEKALGKYLPDGAEVHHFDSDRQNNANTNLVICESHDYHHLLHLRSRALAASGNAGFRKCCICGKWDDLALMYIRPPNPKGRSAKHKTCKYTQERKRLLSKASQNKQLTMSHASE